MAKNVGRTARQKRWAKVLSLMVVVAAGVLFMRPVFAVHDLGLFELDRNALDAAGTPGEDWETIYKSHLSPPTATSVADASSFTTDPDGSTIFTGGGSKDDLDVNNWQSSTGNVPPKDDLLNAFAARYGDIVYFGADRTANNGDAVMGFWFFQNEINLQPDGTFGPNRHEDGDVLVLSDFTGGGANTTIRVFRWNGPGGTIPGQGAINGTLDLLAGTLDTPADCVGPPAVPNGDHFCATVNTTAQTSPWPFVPKVGSPGSFARGELYEGGIDLAFLGLGGECFASFLAETRSSQSVDATLKDFVGGQFQHCESSVKTTPSDASKNPVTSITLGQSIYDYAVVTGTGSNQAPTGTMTFHICKPSELTNGACETGGTLVSTNNLTTVIPPPASTSEALSDAYTPNETGTWCWRGDYSGDDQYPAASDASTGECFQVVQLQPTIATQQTWTVTDKATISVEAGAGNLDGSVKFELFQNSTTCANTALLTTTKSISGALSQDATSDTLTITLPGGPNTYSWRVTYTSNNPGHKGVTSACHTENATLTFTNGS